MPRRLILLLLLVLFPFACLAQTPIKVILLRDLGMQEPPEALVVKFDGDAFDVHAGAGRTDRHFRIDPKTLAVTDLGEVDVKTFAISMDEFRRRIEVQKKEEAERGTPSRPLRHGNQKLVKTEAGFDVVEDGKTIRSFNMPLACPNPFPRDFFVSDDRVAIEECDSVRIYDKSGRQIYRMPGTFAWEGEIERRESVFVYFRSVWTLKDELPWSDDWSSGRRASVYCTDSGKQLFDKKWRATRDGVDNVAFSSDAKVLAIAATDRITFYSIDTSPCQL